MLPSRHEPFDIGGVLGKVIIMDFYDRTRVAKRLGDDVLAQATVYEEDN